MLQIDAIDILKTGANVFLTGEPGAGKSHTVREYVKYLRAHDVSIALTASTGIAATHIGGMTIHSWSGIGIRKFITRRECKELATNKNLRRRVCNASVLIIDEISMLDAATIDAIDMICRVLREDDRPFGGVQVVFVGDFFQLPPVSRQGEAPTRFAFDSRAWADVDPTVCYLSEQYRQEDPAFLEILSALRSGTIDQEHADRLHARRLTTDSHDITKLYSHNIDVDQMNTKKLRTLLGKEKTYTMTSSGNPKLVEQMKRGCLSPEKLVLRIGARVMFTRNNPIEGYVNGSLGDVVDYDQETKFPIVQLTSGRVITAEPGMWSVEIDGTPLATLRQLPLRLAWAMTVHKSQGMTLDSAFIDLGQAFAYGQGYVALSRVRSLEGLFLGGLNSRALEVDPVVLRNDEIFRTKSLATESAFSSRLAEDRAERALEFIRACGGKKEARVIETIDALSAYFPTKPAKKAKEPKWAPTVALIIEGKSIMQAAKERARTVGTIVDHLAEAQLLEKLPSSAFDRLRDAEKTFQMLFIRLCVN
ncbi:MAG: AAA family ATPase [Patescibacteria group bacterium]|jgi:ATP-dependent exoDNAse (exonuclease V) alpha subunit